MKKILFFLCLLAAFSCQKPKDIFNSCGMVVEKYIQHGGSSEINYFIVIEKNSQLYIKQIGLIEYNETSLYSFYCVG